MIDQIYDNFCEILGHPFFSCGLADVAVVRNRGRFDFRHAKPSSREVHMLVLANRRCQATDAGFGHVAARDQFDCRRSRRSVVVRY